MRLIDADGNYALYASDNTDYSLCFGGGIISVIDKHGHIACEFFADDAPTIDTIPVIRCKDCRFCRKYKYREDICTCLKFDSGRNMYDYCSYAKLAETDFGERRNDETD